jgi:hypothetical protein
MSCCDSTRAATVRSRKTAAPKRDLLPAFRLELRESTLQRGTDAKPQLRQTDNVGEVEVLEVAVTRNIQENRFDALRSANAISWRQHGAFRLLLLRGRCCGRNELVSAGAGALMILRIDFTRSN